jgi:hypothetical protein
MLPARRANAIPPSNRSRCSISLPVTSGAPSINFPRQGSKKPWKLYQNYVLDLVSLRFGSVNDKALEFARRRESVKAA